MKVLVTGASGFIGHQCCAQLSALGYEVHAVSSKSQSNNKVHWHKLDLLDSQQSIKLMRNIKPTHLLHLAWYAEPGEYWTSIKNYHWVKASLTLFEEFVESGGKRVVVAGSCAEYDWGFENYSEDTTPLLPVTLYGMCKHSLQMMLSSYASLKGLSFAWGRIFSIYGPRENPKRLFASVIQALLQGHTVKCNNGALTRDYLHVNDVASAFVALLNSDVQGPINIGSGSGVTLKTVVGKIEKIIGNYGCLRLNNQPNAANEPPIIIADTKRLNNIGWTPIYNIDTGLDDTIDWFKEN
ncbi:NAD(P)-dependent oxidoreductase [Porticoccaceae bacterium]|nr:NAD(P)-dependent oxidoreductase [Porticoccaceae bacterium]